MGIAEVARPAVEADARPLGDPRQRGDAAADADVAGDPEMGCVHGCIPVAGGVRGCVTRRRSTTVAGPRLPAASEEPHATRRSKSLRSTRSPSTLDALLALPGVGQYTARAVLVFAFEADEAVVDTNIARVLARVTGRPLTSKQAQAAADTSLVPGDSWAWNQCLMDLGAALCRPASPKCEICPLARCCAWRGRGRRSVDRIRWSEHSSGPLRRQRPPGPWSAHEAVVGRARVERPTCHGDGPRPCTRRTTAGRSDRRRAGGQDWAVIAIAADCFSAVIAATICSIAASA